MSHILLRFHIRDLEQFTGVKAHTLRVWERRYGLLAPDRTDTNIRTYDLDELKVILNVAFLNQRGHKISRLAAMTADEREKLVRTTAMEDPGVDGILNTLVVAMLGFEEPIFDRICDRYEQEHGFRALVEQIFMKLLGRIGLLWQSSAICPAQEHFVSNLIRQRLIAATANQPTPTNTDSLHVLFLPDQEVHELGLLYVNYLLRSHGKRTLYLGQSVPVSDLAQVAKIHGGQLTYIAQFVVHPSAADAPRYLLELRRQLPEERMNFLLAFAASGDLAKKDVPSGMELVTDVSGMISAIDR